MDGGGEEDQMKDYVVRREGEAEILMRSSNNVFFNKAQKVLFTPHDEKSNGKCEDHSQDDQSDSSNKLLMTQSAKGHEEPKPPRVLEALAASGLRAIRYAREVEGIGQITALDNDKVSVEACQRNIQFNVLLGFDWEANLGQGNEVDLDPYGSPSVFLDSAVQSVADGGMLMCTATDMAVLCGGNGEGNIVMKWLLESSLQALRSASAMKNTPLKLSYVYQCVGYDSFHLQCIGRTFTKNNSRYMPGFGPVVPRECSDCGKKFNMGGHWPIWSAPIHDQEWVAATLADVKAKKERYPAYDKIYSVLTTISEELVVPLFLSLHNLCATLKCTSPSAVLFRSTVINAGYRISWSHVNPLGLKSDAPMDVIWDIMRCWVKNHLVKPQPADQSGTVILSKEPTLQANFARAFASLSKAQAKKVARFLPNPERHWGPKLRAGRQITSKHVSLLGADVVNGIINHDEEEDCKSSAKRQKTDDGDLTSSHS
ncbi:putative tRNA (guanine(26)-N(2))-dimethyltransferase 2 [Acorus calamus]|uniref:tRNA (guanine(26)-N(2))-dimethyltransferase n=1 Tax=Acorus calamus TaxID=4465 RepID=A0AAV9DXS5_ACOCL|nr:putative tRNA (guanine(26)-N(2))-dimethyltransferase 2 [Acorus calamus]